MAQHDYVIANGTGAAVRSDLNNGLAAIVSQNSGSSAPATTYAYMTWADTTAGVMKMRNGANNAWITLYQLDGEWSTIAFENGSAAAPSIYFKDSGTDTGVYSPGTDQVAISTGGTVRLSLSTTAVSSALAIDHPLGAVGTPSITFTGDLNTGIYSPAADTLAFVEGGVEAMRIDSSGRVGIGTTSVNATRKVEIVQNSGYDAGLRILTDGSGAYNQFFSGASNFRIGSPHNTSALVFDDGATERARIDSSGRLLVGTSTALDTSLIGIYGNSNDAGDGSLSLRRRLNASNGEGLGVIKFGDLRSGSNYAEIAAAADGVTGTNDYPGRLTFSTTADGASSPTERMRIDSSGNLLFNTTSIIDVSNFTAVIKPSTNFATIKAPDTNSYNVFQFHNNSGTRVGYIQFTTTSTAYVTSSDYRLKENVVAVNDGIARLRQLKPSRFNFIADSDKTVDGFLAHEVQAIVPECVTGAKDAVDDDGNPVYQGIDQSKLVPLLTAALQEAIGEIESLKARVVALEAA